MYYCIMMSKQRRHKPSSRINVHITQAQAASLKTKIWNPIFTQQHSNKPDNDFQGHCGNNTSSNIFRWIGSSLTYYRTMLNNRIAILAVKQIILAVKIDRTRQRNYNLFHTRVLVANLRFHCQFCLHFTSTFFCPHSKAFTTRQVSFKNQNSLVSLNI